MRLVSSHILHSIYTYITYIQFQKYSYFQSQFLELRGFTCGPDVSAMWDANGDLGGWPPEKEEAEAARTAGLGVVIPVSNVNPARVRFRANMGETT